MKKVLIAIATLFVLTGCGGRVTPSVAASLAQMYDTTETFYVKGQEIVVINADLLDESTLDKLKQIDKTAKLIGTTKSILTSDELSKYEKLEQEYEKLEQEYDEIQEYFDNHKADLWPREMILRHEKISEILGNYDRMQRTIEVLEK